LSCLIHAERLTTSGSGCGMSDKELEAVSEEDLESFEALVVDFYQKPWEESYALLRAEIKRRLLRRVAYSAYNWRFKVEADDLVTRVVIRYSTVYGKMRRAGVTLDSFEAMLEDRVRLVTHEAIRRYSKEVPGGGSPDLRAAGVLVDRALEDEEERERVNRCMAECLRKLPERARRVLIEYCDTNAYPPHERSEMRTTLALREAGVPVDGATPEQRANARRNLRVMVSKLRKDRLQPCKESCLRALASRRGAADG
jgi:DNA-directed RNA polymerase specialized sigma24 family protein